jgi:hypothetical protein
MFRTIPLLAKPVKSIAEELVFDEINTGAENDLQRATAMVRPHATALTAIRKASLMKGDLARPFSLITPDHSFKSKTKR